VSPSCRGERVKPLDQRERSERARPKGEEFNCETKGRGAKLLYRQGKELHQEEKEYLILRILLNLDFLLFFTRL